MKPESIKIKQASLADAPFLTALVNSAYRGESSKAGWTTEADLLDGIRVDQEKIIELISQKNSYILKAVEGDKIIGCVHLDKHNEKCYLGMLTVSPTLQNSGLGKKLLLASEKFAQEQMQCSKVYMNVISIRQELILWYVRRGYHLTGEIKPFPMEDPRFGIPKTKLEFLILQKNL